MDAGERRVPTNLMQSEERKEMEEWAKSSVIKDLRGWVKQRKEMRPVEEE